MGLVLERRGGEGVRRSKLLLMAALCWRWPRAKREMAGLVSCHFLATHLAL